MESLPPTVVPSAVNGSASTQMTPSGHDGGGGGVTSPRLSVAWNAPATALPRLSAHVSNTTYANGGDTRAVASGTPPSRHASADSDDRMRTSTFTSAAPSSSATLSVPGAATGMRWMRSGPDSSAAEQLYASNMTPVPPTVVRADDAAGTSS